MHNDVRPVVHTGVHCHGRPSFRKTRRRNRDLKDSGGKVRQREGAVPVRGDSLRVTLRYILDRDTRIGNASTGSARNSSGQSPDGDLGIDLSCWQNTKYQDL